jgi:hypothetical protein
MKTCISAELTISALPGQQVATHIVEFTGDDEVEDKSLIKDDVTLALHAYNSQGTEKGEGCQLDIELSVLGEEREKTEKRPYGGHHRIEVTAYLDKAQARAVRDQINAFLEFE